MSFSADKPTSQSVPEKAQEQADEVQHAIRSLNGRDRQGLGGRSRVRANSRPSRLVLGGLSCCSACSGS